MSRSLNCDKCGELPVGLTTCRTVTDSMFVLSVDCYEEEWDRIEDHGQFVAAIICPVASAAYCVRVDIQSFARLVGQSEMHVHRHAYCMAEIRERS